MDAIDRNLERIDVALRRKRFFLAVPVVEPESARLPSNNALRPEFVSQAEDVESPDVNIQDIAPPSSEGHGHYSDMSAHYSGERSPEDISTFPASEISRETRPGFGAFLRKLFGIRRD